MVFMSGNAIYILTVWFSYFFLYRYDKGAHLFLPSYVMRTHGARQQREAVKRAPKEQMQSVFEVQSTVSYLCRLDE